MKIDSKTVRRLTLPADLDDKIFFDSTLTGFGYRVRRAARARLLRSYVVQYRRAGRSRRMLLGSADVLTAEQARAAAKKILASVALGEDPAAEKGARRHKDAHSLKTAIEDYLAVKRDAVRPRTYAAIMRYLTGPHFKPLHVMPLDQITRKDVAHRLARITAEHGSITAVRARGALSSLYSWAMGMGLVEHNPVVGTFRPKDAEPRERVLEDRELAAIWRSAGDGAYGKVIKLLILTGARRAEIGGMRWSEIDRERAVWSVPANRTKNGRPLILPLQPMAIEIIQSVPERVGRDHLFGSRSADGLAHWHAKADLDQRLGAAVKPWRLHDIRRTVATRMADLGVQPHVIEAVLNHYSGHRSGVAGIYNRSVYEREVRAVLALWADHVQALVKGGERKIVPLKADRKKLG